MNLAITAFAESGVFKALNDCTSLVFNAELKSKVLLFKAFFKKSETDVDVFLLNIISKESKMFYESVVQMIKMSLDFVVSNLRGMYTFELLSVNIANGIDFFDYRDLSQILINNSKKMRVTDSVLVKYGSLYAIFSMRTNQDWGKIIFKNAVKNFTNDNFKLDLELKSILRNIDFANNSEKRIIINDISKDAIYCNDNIEQVKRLDKVVKTIEFAKAVRVNILYADNVIDTYQNQN